MLEYFTEWGPLTRGAIAFGIAFAVSMAIGNKVILKLVSMKLGQPVRSKEEINELFDLHGQKAGTPTMGGVMIIATMLLALILACDFTNPYIQVSVYVLLGLGLLGFKDDYAKISKGNAKGVSSKFKLVWQFKVGLVAALWLFFNPSIKIGDVSIEGIKGQQVEVKVASEEMSSGASSTSVGAIVEAPVDSSQIDRVNQSAVRLGEAQRYFGALYIPLIDTHISLGYLLLGFMVLVIIGASNAVNLTDGLDGLASGVTISTGLAYVVIVLVGTCSTFDIGLLMQKQWVVGSGAAELLVFNLAMIGAVAGFLWFNAYPAKMFMGDTGSLALGGAIGVVAIACKQELLLVIIGFVFVAEALSVMVQLGYFKYTKKRHGEGVRLLKCAPIHHHFELSGWKETQVITRFWIISAICSGLGLIILLG